MKKIVILLFLAFMFAGCFTEITVRPYHRPYSEYYMYYSRYVRPYGGIRWYHTPHVYVQKQYSHHHKSCVPVQRPRRIGR